LTAVEQEELAGQLARFARSSATQQLLADLLKDPTASWESQRIVLRAMALSGLREAPEAWIVGLTQMLAGDDARLLREAVAAAGGLRVAQQHAGKLAAALLPVGANEKVPVDVRLSALAAVPGGLTKVEPADFAFLRSHLGPDQPVAARSAAADVLSLAKLN